MEPASSLNRRCKEYTHLRLKGVYVLSMGSCMMSQCVGVRCNVCG